MDSSNALRLGEDDYDKAIFHPVIRGLYGESKLYNYGLWSSSAHYQLESLQEAARSLVHLHLSSDDALSNLKYVLDVGCGLGECSYILAMNYPNARVVGINYSEYQTRFAEINFGITNRLSFLRSDASSVNMPSSSIDTIHAIEAAMHFRTRKDFFLESYRLLVPGGKLILTDALSSIPSSFVPEENCVSSVEEYNMQLVESGFTILNCTNIFYQTVIPFAEMLCKNSLQPYARIILGSVQSYYHIVAIK